MRPTRVAGIFAKPFVPEAVSIVPELVAWLTERGIQARLDQQAADYAGLEGGLPRDEVPEGCDLILVLGGDGTLLGAARALRGRDIPVLAINLGGLGFLTSTTATNLYVELETVLTGEARIGRRAMIHCDLIRGGEVVAEYEALNDAVITKTSLARMIDLEAYVDTHFVCTYKSDGLIIATPTGSTAYSLSAGGPIIFPTVAGIAVTPICPHTLTNRPVILPEQSVVTIICHAADEDAYLTIDGQVGGPLRKADELVCRSSSHALHLVRPPRLRYFDVLRAKLKWGER